MSMKNLYLVSIDPGTTTGVCTHSLTEGEVNFDFNRYELGPKKHHKELFQKLAMHRPDVLIVEQFEYRIVRNQGVDMPGIVLDSKEYIGVCELYQQFSTNGNNHPCELVYQGAHLSSQDKGVWTDKMLKRLGLYNAPNGRQHMNDATRHMLNYIVSTLGRRDYIKALYPKPPESE